MLRQEPLLLIGVDLNSLFGVYDMIHAKVESRVRVQDYLPKIDDSISSSPPQHTVQLVMPIPVIMVGRKIGGFNLVGEVPLDVFRSVDETGVGGIPHHTVVFHCWVHHLFQESQHDT